MAASDYVRFDKLPQQTHDDYARRATSTEVLKNRFGPHVFTPAATEILDVRDKPTAMDALLGYYGISATQTISWAAFEPPPMGWNDQRSSLFSYETIPGFHNILDKISSKSQIPEKIKNLCMCCKMLDEEISFVKGRVGQFLRG